MVRFFNNFFNRFSLSPKRLFLIDILGALLSFLLLFVIAKMFSFYFGIPQIILYLLSIIALLIAIYSIVYISCRKNAWRSYLISISAINFLYCILTIVVLIYYWHTITSISLIYFSVELIIISLILLSELYTSKIISTNKNSRNG